LDNDGAEMTDETVEPMRPGAGPLYKQVKQRLIRHLVGETWGPGDVLPSEPKLAERFGVSSGTVRKALDELTAENVVMRHQGKGTIVARHDPERSLFHFFRMTDAAGAVLTPTSRVLSCTRRRARKSDLDRLELPSGAHVVEIERVRDLAGQPAMLERIVLSVRLFSGLEQAAADLPNALYVYYEENYGVTVYRAREGLRAIAADARDVALLPVVFGQPMLEIDRIALTLDGNPVEWRVSRCATEHSRYSLELV
jgi:GntR family transcriptional regulator